MSRSQEEEPSVSGERRASAPWPQRLYENIWLWAGAALVFWFVSYVIWGVVDLLVLPGG